MPVRATTHTNASQPHLDRNILATLQDAAAAMEPLQTALWAEHRLAVLLPPGTRIPGQQQVDEELEQDGEDAKSSTSHELASSSPFSGEQLWARLTLVLCQNLGHLHDNVMC